MAYPSQFHQVIFSETDTSYILLILDPHIASHHGSFIVVSNVTLETVSYDNSLYAAMKSQRIHNMEVNEKREQDDIDTSVRTDFNNCHTFRAVQ